MKCQLKLDIIDEDGARDEFSMISKKEHELCEKLVFNNHVTVNGKLRSISHHEPSVGNTKDYYSTKMSDGKKSRHLHMMGS